MEVNWWSFAGLHEEDAPSRQRPILIFEVQGQPAVDEEWYADLNTFH